MSAPEPRENPRLLGHEAAENAFLHAWRGGRLHHAWLITGPAGIGKATLAFRVARWLLSGPARADSMAMDPRDPVFRRVAAGSHADLLVVGREYDEKKRRFFKAIRAEDARGIPSFMRLTPAEAGWRVAIVDGAEALNRESANSLLKVLEEPPRRALLMLVTSAPGLMLPTIRSRVRHLPLSPLPAPVATGLLRDHLPDAAEDQRARLAALAEGSPGRALALAADDGLALAELARELLGQAPRVPLLRGYELADRLGRSETGFATFMDLLRGTLADAVRRSVSGTAGAAEAAMLRARPLAEWADLWHGLGRLQDETERFNLDKRQAVVSGLAMLNGS